MIVKCNNCENEVEVSEIDYNVMEMMSEPIFCCNRCKKRYYGDLEDLDYVEVDKE